MIHLEKGRGNRKYSVSKRHMAQVKNKGTLQEPITLSFQSPLSMEGEPVEGRSKADKAWMKRYQLRLRNPNPNYWMSTVEP